MNARQRRADRRRFNRRYRASMAHAEERLSTAERAILDDWYRTGHRAYLSKTDQPTHFSGISGVLG
jgi:hypothetical protein